MTWPTIFEDTMRTHLPLIGENALSPTASLIDLGLDSLGTVSLLLDLEETFALTIPDDELTTETFQSPQALWSVLAGLGAASQHH